MNSKAIKRQLLAAIAMVLVAAIALGSSTYAWFVASGSVTAKDMKVNVQSSGGLVISYAGADDAWGVTASGKMTNSKALTPVSTSDMTDWSTAQAKVANNYEFDKTTIKNVKNDVLPSGTYSDNNNYAVMRAFKIRSAAPGQLCQGLYVEKIEVTGSDNTLDTSLRVGFRYKYATGNGNYGETSSFITGPVTVTSDAGQSAENEPTATYKFYSTSTTDEAEAKDVTLTATGKTARIVPAETEVTNGTDKPVYVEIFIWFEGQDHNLFSDNVKAIDNMDITVTFTSDSMANPTV